MTTAKRLVDQLDWDLLDRLSKSLRVSGISVGEMAKLLGVSRNTVGLYLSGKTPISDERLTNWAVYTDIPYEWFVSDNLTRSRNRRRPAGGGIRFLHSPEQSLPLPWHESNVQPFGSRPKDNRPRSYRCPRR